MQDFYEPTSARFGDYFTTKHDDPTRGVSTDAALALIDWQDFNNIIDLIVGHIDQEDYLQECPSCLLFNIARELGQSKGVAELVGQLFDFASAVYFATHDQLQHTNISVAIKAERVRQIDQFGITLLSAPQYYTVLCEEYAELLEAAEKLEILEEDSDTVDASYVASAHVATEAVQVLTVIVAWIQSLR